MEKRVVIAVVLSIAVMYGYSYLFPPPKQPAVAGKPVLQVASSAGRAAAPVALETARASAAPVLASASQPERDVVVDTDLYEAVFSNRGGALKKFVLKKYRESATAGAKPVTLCNEDLPGNFTLQSAAKGFPFPADAVYDVTGGNRRVEKGGTSTLVFTLTTPEGVTFAKNYTFQGDSYAIGLREELTNGGQGRLDGALQLVLKNRVDMAKGDTRFEVHGPVTFADNALQAPKLTDVAKEPRSYDKGVLWSGFNDKYFLGAAIAAEGSIAAARVTERNNMVEDVISSPAFSVDPGKGVVVSYHLFFGPKDLDVLKAQGGRLEEVIDYGWFSAIAKPLLYAIKFFYKYTGNYGFAIIIITVILKFIFFPLTHKSYKSMKEMQKLQPKMNKLKEKFKDDRDGLNRAVMELYREHKVNPLGGCLPMIVQIPVFFALYKALMFSIELRQAPFMLWIQDLSAKDPYYVTPIIMGVTMVVQQKMTPSTGMDPVQAKMMMALPVVFTFMFLNFPSGLVLYWLVNNILTIAQQYYINKKLS